MVSFISRPLASAALATVLLAAPAGFAQIASAARSAEPDYTAQHAAAAQVLQRWYNEKGLWDTTGWWNAAHCLEAIESAVLASNGRDYLGVLRETFERNSGENFLNEFYDDEGWWALAWIRAYDLTGDVRYLNMAKVIFEDMVTGWDDHCKGGIWWKKDRRYKNAVANELFFLVAIKLHQRTPGDAGPGSYLDWTLREWAWFKASGMINDQHLINDGLNRNCENNKRTTWTYNQGVILGALTELYKSTGNQEYLRQAASLADAACSTLVYTNGVLKEPCEPDRCGGADVPQFKGIFIRYLADLYDITLKPEYRDLIVRSAQATWLHNRDAQGRFGLRWIGPVDEVDAARHSSAMMPLGMLALPDTGVPLRGENIWPASELTHEIGRPDGLGFWCADAVRDQESGYLVKSSVPANLTAGKHTAVFELKVDNFNLDHARVATLSVVSTRTGKVVVDRDLKRSDFKNILFHRFELRFKAKEGESFEFRTYWHYAPEAPRLTQRTLSITR